MRVVDAKRRGPKLLFVGTSYFNMPQAVMFLSGSENRSTGPYFRHNYAPHSPAPCISQQQQQPTLDAPSNYLWLDGPSNYLGEDDRDFWLVCERHGGRGYRTPNNHSRAEIRCRGDRHRQRTGRWVCSHSNIFVIMRCGRGSMSLSRARGSVS